MKEKTLVIMAAGLGSRFGGLKQIKCLGPQGEFLIDYTLYDAWQSGFTHAVLIIREGLESELQTHFANKIFTTNKSNSTLPQLPPLKISYVVQKLDDLPTGFSVPAGREKPWGTGHALWSARKLIHGPFVVCSADDFYGRETMEILSQALEEMSDSKNQYAMVAHHLGETLSDAGSVSRGICKIDNQNYLTSIHEHTHIEKKDLQIISIEKNGTEHILDFNRPVSMAIFAFTPEFFDYIETDFIDFLKNKIFSDNSKNNINPLEIEFFTPNVVNKLIETNKITMKVYPTNAKWFGLTNSPDCDIAKNQIKKMINSGKYPQKI